MTDAEELVRYFPGVDPDYIENVIDEIGDARPEWVADVLTAAADEGIVPPGDYRGQYLAQIEEDLVAAACPKCGKAFLADDIAAAERKVQGHQSSHPKGVDESDAVADGGSQA